MKSIASLMMCLGLLSLSVGCATSDVVRGQNSQCPCEYHSGGGGGGGAMGMSGGMGMVHGPGPHYYDGPAHSHGGGMSCPPGVEVWRPTHHHTFEYREPKDLRYPDPNQPPGIIQYPYYTVKGPTDFFYKGN